MPVQNGVVTGNAILGLRAFTCCQAIQFYLNSGMKLSRVATPANLRSIASEFTGKPYPRSRRGLEQAFIDLKYLIEQRNDLDSIGETSVVNDLVGGVAADLSA